MNRVCIPAKIVELLWNDDGFFREVANNRKASISRFPRYDQWCDESGLNLSFALAGYSSEDLNLTFKQNRVYLSNKNKLSESSEKDLQQGMIIRGIARRNFSLGFVVSEAFDVTNATAEMRNGLLKLTIPLGSVSEEKNIEIRGE